MKNLLISVGVALAACAAAFGVFFAINDDEAMHRAAREGDAMAWLKMEFHLDDAQFAAIKKLHDDYGVVCAQHCTLITNARQRSAPDAELARLEKLCIDSMTDHFRRVANLMPAVQGERYLGTVLPRIPGYQHVGPPSMQGTP
jgi:hypothetical protein